MDYFLILANVFFLIFLNWIKTLKYGERWNLFLGHMGCNGFFWKSGREHRGKKISPCYLIAENTVLLKMKINNKTEDAYTDFLKHVSLQLSFEILFAVFLLWFFLLISMDLPIILLTWNPTLLSLQFLASEIKRPFPAAHFLTSFRSLADLIVLDGRNEQILFFQHYIHCTSQYMPFPFPRMFSFSSFSCCFSIHLSQNFRTVSYRERVSHSIICF